MNRLVSLLSTVSFVTLAVTASAQEHQGKATDHRATRQGIPLSEVVLYSSGVGYFQRDGEIDGRGHVELRFKTDNINDLLKSMTVQDFDGGQVGTVTYDSRDPVTKTLKTFSVDLTGNPGLGQLLDQIRGERIEIAAPNPVRGVVVGVEKKRERVGLVDAVMEVGEVQYLNILTPDGLRSLPLGQIQRIQITDERLGAELQQALEVLASSHDMQKKSVRLEFDGQGRRRVRVAYVVEAPVWKTSYRLALSETKRPFLQGWAIVENTTDEDWDGVKLSLISGRPISFTMDLYEPLYVKRPVVVSELYESLRPQVYEQAVSGPREKPREAAESLSAMASLPRRFAMRGMSPAAAAPPSPAVAAPVDLEQGVTSAAQALEAGELFQYAIQAPVSLARHKSAMLPIVSQEVAGEKVSIYNQRVNAKHPLNGFRLKNATPLHLMQGPITVFDGGVYAGDARIEDLAPGQDRLISYALDLTTEVEPLASNGQQEQRLVTVSIRKGTLIATRKAVEEKTYNVNNRDQKAKVVIIEHPFRADWKLMEPTDPAERTRDSYRFKVPVDAGGKARLRVHEEKQTEQTVRLIDSGLDMIGVYVQAKQVSPKVREALQRVVALRDRVDSTAAQRGRLEQRIKEINQEQARLRENMAKLPQNSELYARYVTKLDHQETEIETLRKEIEAKKATEDKQKRELTDFLLNLNID